MAGAKIEKHRDELSVSAGASRPRSRRGACEQTCNGARLVLAHVTAHASCGVASAIAATRSVVAEARLHQVDGKRLKVWIEKRRDELTRLRGLVFSQA